MNNESKPKTEDQSSTGVQDKHVSQPCIKPNVSGALITNDDIKAAISAIQQTYDDLVTGDVYPIDEWSTVAKNLKYALRRLGNDR